MPRKKKAPEQPTNVLGTTVTDSPGYTTCTTCNRAMRVEDVDEEGFCPDCAPKLEGA